MIKPEYRDYRIGKYLIDKRTRERFVIVKREHKQRSVFIAHVDTRIELGGTYSNGRWRQNRGNWRTAKELRKHYILLGATAQVLYG